MVWSLALRPDHAKQDPVVYGTMFGVVFLAEGPCTASIQKSFDCFGLYHPGLEEECDFRLVVELLCVPPDAHPTCAGPPGDFNGHIRGFGHGAPWVGEGLHLFVDLAGCFDSHHRPRCTRWGHTHGLRLVRRHG